MPGVILYGPPAAGKDTITAALVERDARFELYRRLKVGGGNTSGYRVISGAELTSWRGQGFLAWENFRYDAVYAIDWPTLRAMLDAGRIPVVHIGQVDAVAAVQAAGRHAQWLTVSLWCPRDVAADRAAQRGSTDVTARLRAWDETEPLADADLALDTAELSPEQAASAIIDRLALLPSTGP